MQVALLATQSQPVVQAARQQFPEMRNVLRFTATTQAATIKNGRITDVAEELA